MKQAKTVPPDAARVPALSGAALIAEARRLAEINRKCGTDHTAAVLERMAELLDHGGNWHAGKLPGGAGRGPAP